MGRQLAKAGSKDAASESRKVTNGLQLAVVKDGEVIGWIGKAVNADHHSRAVVRLARRMLAQDGLQLASCPVTLEKRVAISPGS